MRRFITLLVLAAICIGIYLVIPNRTRQVSLYPRPKLGQALYAIHDSASGGTSVSRIIDSANSIIDRLSLDPNANRNPFAGFGIDLRLLENGYANWTLFDTLYLDIFVQGTNELQIKLLTHDADFTTGERAIYRTLVKEVPVASGWNHLAIVVDHFYVPDWWYSDNGISKEYDRKYLETTARIEILPGNKTPKGQPVLLQLKAMQIMGHSNLYFGILFGTLMFILIIALGTPSRKPKR